MFMNVHSSHASDPTGTSKGHGRGSRSAGRRTARSLAIRTRLLDAADALVSERQSATITARDLSHRAGVADGALYNHFDDKHDLVLQALLRRFSNLVAVYAAATERVIAGASVRGLEGSIDELSGALLDLEDGALPMLANILSEPALFRRFLVEIHRPPFAGVFMDPVQGFVESAQRDGAIGDVDPSAATDLLVGAMLLQSLVGLMSTIDPQHRTARRRAVVRALVSGLAPRLPADLSAAASNARNPQERTAR